jgi:hypothetical protein
MMLDGWRNQQLSRNLQFATIEQRLRHVRRFIDHINEDPWNWTPAMVEEFSADLRAVKHVAHSTLRGYHSALRAFTSYISIPDYGWDRVCERYFGTTPPRCSSTGTPAPATERSASSCSRCHLLWSPKHSATARRSRSSTQTKPPSPGHPTPDVASQVDRMPIDALTLQLGWLGRAWCRWSPRDRAGPGLPRGEPSARRCPRAARRADHGPRRPLRSCYWMTS